MIRRVNTHNWYEFIAGVERLSIDNFSKEYFLKLSYLRVVSGGYSFINELVNPDDPDDIIVVQEHISGLLQQKYE